MARSPLSSTLRAYQAASTVPGRLPRPYKPREIFSFFVRRNAFTKGVMGGQRGWFAVFVALWAGGRVRHFLAREPQHLSIETLQPGQRVIVTALTAAQLAEEKAAAKRARKQRRASTRA